MSPIDSRKWRTDKILKHSEPKPDGKKKEKEEGKENVPENREY